jgi:hypothetical protein
VPHPLFLIRGEQNGKSVLNLTLCSTLPRARQQFIRHHPHTQLLDIQDIQATGVVGARYEINGQPIQEHSVLTDPFFVAHCSSPEMYWRLFLAAACAADHLTRNRVYTLFTPTKELHSSYLIDSLGNVQSAVLYQLHERPHVHLLGGSITRPPLFSLRAESQASLSF